MNLMLKMEEQEMNYLSNSDALWVYFEFHIAHVGNICCWIRQCCLIGQSTCTVQGLSQEHRLSCMNYE